jgi:hypothetical protein
MPFAGKDNLYPGKANMSDKIFLDADIFIYRFRGTKPMVLTMIAVFFYSTDGKSGAPFSNIPN